MSPNTDSQSYSQWHWNWSKVASKISKFVKTDFFTGIFILVAAFLYISHLKSGERPVVLTQNGKVKGIMAFSRDYHKYSAFMGIPYARAPVGDLRFEAPEPPENWEGVREAGHYRSQCISLELLFIGGVLFGEEDCLFLNVFTKPSKTPLPVMVFFHGGMYHFGSAEDHGEKYFMDKDVILVTVTYRLGALGFMSTGDSVVPGNNGLKDQVMALRWIQNNIESFGGDPGQVTIFGESAGGHAVGLHILSPMSRGLFQKAIIQSGAPLSQWGTLKHNAGGQARRFAAKFNCPIDDSLKMVKCLKQLDAKRLVYDGHIEAIDFFRNRPMVFTATIEAVNDTGIAFLNEDPERILEEGNFPKLPLIMGVNADEGLLQSSSLAANATKFALMMSQMELSLPLTLQYRPNHTITEKLITFYFDKLFSNGTREDFLKNFTSMFSDRHFYQPFYRTAKLYSKHAPLYIYYFNFSGFHSMEHFIADRETRFMHPLLSLFVNHSWRVIQEFVLKVPVLGRGVCHGTELPLQFNHPWTPWFYSQLPERDVQMSKDLINLWVSFASSSDSLMLGKQTWEQVKPEEPFKYLEISRNPRIIDEPFTERVTFWESIIDEMEEPEVT